MRRLKLCLPILALLACLLMAQGLARASVLYGDNFDGDTVGSIAPGWTQVSASAQNMVVHATEPISSPNSFGIAAATSANRSSAVYLGGIVQNHMCMQCEYTMRDRLDGSNTSVYSPILELCFSGSSLPSASLATFYSFNFAPKTTNGNSFVSVSKVVSGATDTTWRGGSGAISGSTYGTGYPDGSVIVLKAEVTADAQPVVRFKFWIKGTAEPGWLVTATDTSGNVLTGRPFLNLSMASSTILTPLASVDNVYVADTSSDIPLIAGAVTTTDNQSSHVDLSWAAPTTGKSPYTYDVLRSASSSMTSPTTLVSGQSGTTYSDTTVSPVTTYYYQITAHDAVTTANSNILQVTTPTNLPASTYSVTMPSPSSGPQLFGAIVMIAPNGNLTNGGTLNVVGTDDQGVQTTTASFVGNGGAPTAVSVTYTPTVAGTRTITWSHSGTITGITDPSSSTYTAIPCITPGAVGERESPGNWRGASSRTDQAAGRYTWVPGAYRRYQWSDTSATPSATLFCSYGPTGSGMTVTYIADGTYQRNVVVPAPASNNQAGISISGLFQTANVTHTLFVCLNSSSSASDRWNGQNVLQAYGLQLDTTATPVAWLASKGWVLVWGDSISEALTASVVGGWAAGYVGLTALNLMGQGYDLCASSCSANGWLAVGDINVPALYSVTSGVYSASASRWNKISAPGGTPVSLLDSSSHISAYGATGQEPSVIYINMGTNEQLHNKSVTDTQTAVQLGLASFHAAAPNATIILQIPFGLYNTTVFAANGSGKNGQDYIAAIKAGYTAFQSATPTNLVTMSDFGAALSNTIPSSAMTSDASFVHPNDAGHAYLQQLVGPVITSAAIPTSTITIAGRVHY